MAASTYFNEGKKISQSEAEYAECECCGLEEEYTEAYITIVRERHQGRWICGLCAEAVKDEMSRSYNNGDIDTDEALQRHMKFCESFRSSSPPVKPAEELISAMRHLLIRTLDSPRGKKSKSLFATDRRSKSCLPTMAE